MNYLIYEIRNLDKRECLMGMTAVSLQERWELFQKARPHVLGRWDIVRDDISFKENGTFSSLEEAVDRLFNLAQKKFPPGWQVFVDTDERRA